MTTRLARTNQRLKSAPPQPSIHAQLLQDTPPSPEVDPRDQRIRDLEQVNALLRASLAEITRNAEAQVRLSVEAAGLGAWERDLRTGSGLWSIRMAALHGARPDQVPRVDEWLARIDSADRPAMHNLMAALMSGSSDHFEATYRYMRPDGAVRWVWSRGATVEHDLETGRPIRIAGVARDDTERHESEARRELLAREVDHRAKNALAVVQSVIKLTRADTVGGYARSVDGRIAALARAHDLLSRTTWSGAALTDILDHELAPFLAGKKPEGRRARVTLEGPAVTVAAAAAQPLTMAVHELATNAAKYGALSTVDGTLRIHWHIEAATGTLRLRWVERGGPTLLVRPSRKGFGSRVLEGTIRHQIGGFLQALWEPEGLVCDIHIPARQLAAVGAGGQARDG